MVPTAKRGIYVGGVVMTILPFAPSVLWAQLIVQASDWRYVGAFIAGWNALGLILLFIFYWPPPRPNSHAYTRKEILKRVDYIGGILSIGGVLCFMMGMQWGAQQVYSITSHTRVSSLTVPSTNGPPPMSWYPSSSALLSSSVSSFGRSNSPGIPWYLHASSAQLAGL